MGRSNGLHCAVADFPNQRTKWDGHYYTTFILPDGKVVRVRDGDQLPRPPYTVAMTDNGMLGQAYIARQLAEIRRELREGTLTPPRGK